MIQSFLYNKETKEVRKGGSDLVDIWKLDDNSVLWLDICEVEEREAERLLGLFGFHKLAIQDALRKRHPPKIEAFDDHIFLLLRELGNTDDGINTSVSQLAIFYRENLIVTKHVIPSITVNNLQHDVERRPSLLDRGAKTLALTLANRLVRRYVAMLIDFEGRLDNLEEEMYDAPNDDMLSEITSYKASLRHILRNARYHRTIADELKENPAVFINENSKHFIIDLHEQVERTQSLTALYYDVLKDLSDGYIALSSHRLNQIMKVLTIITVIFVPLTFLAGIYGMNFEYMPELTFRQSYFVVIGIMVVAVIFQLILFRRNRWL